MTGLQPGHVIIILFVALLFFVPSRLPLLARGMKKMVSEFRDETTGRENSPSSAAKPVESPPPKE
jgi:Sec-independent protein translocase protein TatA